MGGVKDRMLTRQTVREQIEKHVEGLLTLEDLSAWAELMFRGETFEQKHADLIQDILSILRDTTDPHRFRWEEPDFDAILVSLED